MSRIKMGEDPTNLEEGLPDVQLFIVRITNRHFEDIIHFLMTRTTPKGYTTQQKKELVVCAIEFFVIVGHLHKIGFDEVLR